MKGLKFFTLVALLLFAVGCAQSPTDAGILNLPEIPEEKSEPAAEMPEVIEEEPVAEVTEAAEVEVSDSNLGVGDSTSVGSKTITIKSIEAGPKVKVDVSGTVGILAETRADEIINGLVITLDTFNYDVKDSPENYVTLTIEALSLGEDEYLLLEGEKITLGDMEIELKEVKTDASIYVHMAPSRYGDERVRVGYPEKFGNLEISPLKTFTKDTTRPNYAIVKIVLLEEES